MSSFDAMRECAAGFIVVTDGPVGDDWSMPTFAAAVRFATERARLLEQSGEIVRADNHRIVARFEWKGGPFDSVAFTHVHDVNPVPLPHRYPITSDMDDLRASLRCTPPGTTLADLEG